MIPAGYSNFFNALAGTEATLFWVIFAVISIAPAGGINAQAALERQIKILTSYGAMLNSLILSLFAMLPGQTIGEDFQTSS
ncbi:MAG: hypothetical protein WCE68_15615 [Anaerolineales bacterium]